MVPADVGVLAGAAVLSAGFKTAAGVAPNEWTHLSFCCCTPSAVVFHNAATSASATASGTASVLTRNLSFAHSTISSREALDIASPERMRATTAVSSGFKTPAVGFTR